MNEEFNLAAVVIWYKPETIGIEKILENINSYGPQVGKIYIVDNSPQKNHEYFSRLSNSVYIYNNNKGGIAGATNLGVKQAQEDGFNWIMTVDQDSMFASGEFEKYLSLVEEYSRQDKTAVSFGPHINNLNEKKYITKQFRYKVLSPIKRKIYSVIRKNWKPAVLPEVEINKNLIASANIVKTSVLEEVNYYDEKLFIDQVDYDLCSRIRNKGYRTVRLNKVSLDQIYGESKFKFFIRPKSVYSQFRLYYIVRNHLIMMSRYEYIRPLFQKELREFYWQYCVFSTKAFKNRKVFKKAYADAASFIENEKESK